VLTCIDAARARAQGVEYSGLVRTPRDELQGRRSQAEKGPSRPEPSRRRSRHQPSGSRVASERPSDLRLTSQFSGIQISNCGSYDPVESVWSLLKRSLPAQGLDFGPVCNPAT
jgi:hypothetical protein